MLWRQGMAGIRLLMAPGQPCLPVPAVSSSPLVIWQAVAASSQTYRPCSPGSGRASRTRGNFTDAPHNRYIVIMKAHHAAQCLALFALAGLASGIGQHLPGPEPHPPQ